MRSARDGLNGSQRVARPPLSKPQKRQLVCGNALGPLGPRVLSTRNLGCNRRAATKKAETHPSHLQGGDTSGRSEDVGPLTWNLSMNSSPHPGTPHLWVGWKLLSGYCMFVCVCLTPFFLLHWKKGRKNPSSHRLEVIDVRSPFLFSLYTFPNLGRKTWWGSCLLSFI